jgi:hypothetical protein
MRVALLLCLLLTVGICSFSQDRFSLKPGITSNLKPYYSKDAGAHIDTIHLQVVLTGKFDTAANTGNNTLNLAIEKFNLPNKPRIADSAHITFPKSAWHADGSAKDTTLIINLITESIPDSLKNDEIGHLVITGKSDNFHTLRLTNTALGFNTKYNPDKSFWVEVGANFDLIDGLEANNFYSGVFLSKRDIRPFSFKKKDPADDKEKNLSIFAGVYESKSITSSTEQNYSLQQYYDSTSFLTSKRDTMQVYDAIGNFITRRTVRNVGLFLSPQVRLTNGSANGDGLHVFASFWAELQWQKVEEEINFNQLKKLDTSYMPIRQILIDTSNIKAGGLVKKTTDQRSHYIGFGLPVFLKETVNNNVVHLYVNPVFGLSSQPTAKYLLQQSIDPIKQLDAPRRCWQPFYLVQFRLNEETYGISFTGEVRGLLLSNNKPIVSLALSKKFDLSKFMEYNK